jgi:hypothetical protein
MLASGIRPKTWHIRDLIAQIVNGPAQKEIESSKSDRTGHERFVRVFVFLHRADLCLAQNASKV